MNIIDGRKDKSDIAYINQKEIADKLCVSPTKVSQRLKQLIRYGSIRKIDSGVYKLLANDLWHTPYQTTHRVVLLYKSNPGLNYNEQAEVLKVTYNDIVRAWSYINMLNIR